MGRGWPRIFSFCLSFSVFFLSSFSSCYWQPLRLAFFYLVVSHLCPLYVGCLCSWCLLSRCVFLPHLHSLFSLAHHCDYCDPNRDQNYPFFQSGAKIAAHSFFDLSVCMHINALVNWKRKNKPSQSVGEQVAAQWASTPGVPYSQATSPHLKSTDPRYSL